MTFGLHSQSKSYSAPLTCFAVSIGGCDEISSILSVGTTLPRRRIDCHDTLTLLVGRFDRGEDAYRRSLPNIEETTSRLVAFTTADASAFFPENNTRLEETPCRSVVLLDRPCTESAFRRTVQARPRASSPESPCSLLSSSH